MLDSVFDSQPVISRLARSKGHLLSSIFESPNLTSKISLLGQTSPRGFFSSHRRINPDLGSPAPSSHDDLLLSGGGLEPTLKISPDAKAPRAKRNSSFCTSSSSTLKESRPSTASTHKSFNEKSDLELEKGSCSEPLLTSPLTPPVASREVSNSVSSVISLIVSTLAVTKPASESRGERSEQKLANTEEFNQPCSVPKTKMPSKWRYSAMLSNRGDQVDGGAHPPRNVFEVRFSPPSFIRPRGRKLVARREPSPLIHMSSKENLYDDFVNSDAKNGRDEGIALCRTPVERDVIPEEDEALENIKSDYPDPMAQRNHVDQHRYMAQQHYRAKHDQSPQAAQISDHNRMQQQQRDPVQVSPRVPEQEKRQSSEEVVSDKIAEQIDSIVEAAALDETSKSEWRAYIENYSKGSFNISNPPAPPPVSPKLRYLPSIFPRGEAQRVSVFNAHRLSWNTITADKLTKVLVSVMVKFGMGSGAISFFNDKNEYIKAERGYNLQNISRPCSIAAHGLLSADVFVILDTEKDWRFHGHPLVVAGPKIRFFAGAPLLGEGGQPIGMLSIFSQESQPCFSPLDRRELADYAAEAMKDLKLGSEVPQTSKGPSAPSFEGSPVAGDHTKTKKLDVTGLSNTDEQDSLPPFLQYHKLKTLSTRLVRNRASHDSLVQPNHDSTRVVRNRASHDSLLQPNHDSTRVVRSRASHDSLVQPNHDSTRVVRNRASHDSLLQQNHDSTRVVRNQRSHDSLLQPNHGSLPRSSRRNLRNEDEFERPRYDQSYAYGVNGGTTLYKLDALNIREFVPPSSRPFSSSDVSSIHKHPTNSPVHSQLGLPTTPGVEFAQQLLRSLVRAKYSENAQEDDGQSVMSHGRPTGLSPRKATMRSKTPNSSRASSPRIISPSVVSKDNSTLSGSRPTSRENARAKAALICSRAARVLDYDLIYAVELNPSLDAIDETKIFQPGVLPIRVLAAYGMNEPFRPDAQVHVEALRSKGCYFWQAPPNAKDTTGGYQSGCLIAIPTQGGAQHLRTSGIVIGAFKKPRPDKENTFKITNEELQVLVDAGNEVKSLFWPIPISSPRQAPHTPHTEPMSEPYPAHDAVQIGQYPRSPYPRNPSLYSSYSVNRAESRLVNQYGYQNYAQDRFPDGHKSVTPEPAAHPFNRRMALDITR